MAQNPITTVGLVNNKKNDRADFDYYATDGEALEHLIYTLAKYEEKLHIYVWEPSAGGGNLSKVMLEDGHTVVSTDIVERDFPLNMTQNFLETKHEEGSWPGDILTNPPYEDGMAEDFAREAIKCLKKGNRCYLLLKTTFLESVERIPFFEDHPPKYIYTHCKRIKIRINNLTPSEIYENRKIEYLAKCEEESVEPDMEKVKKPQGNALFYSWFVWEKGFTGETILRPIKPPNYNREKHLPKIEKKKEDRRKKRRAKQAKLLEER